ncbi:class-II fumarase/aspartase family protein [Marinobacter gelidimuriae]|uniref:class-II fumarase/aspartase family protein n=1 Tax=Marinobacter gelidimuriae TaxID=2739064 RepID=UPI00037BDBC0|nr:adenylosuccinate lyase family protein [Marinobacter gelidimuriae]
MPERHLLHELGQSLQGHITDSYFFGHAYTTDMARGVFDDRHRMQRWLDIEATLALAQAELGIIPSWAAEEIAAKAQLENLDLQAVQQGIRDIGHSFVPLLREFQRACDQGAGEFLHYGATTQDIQDTGQVLEMRDAADLILADLDDILDTLLGLCEQYRNQPMIGRTHSQPALPMTLGVKIAGWIDELARDRQRLTRSRDSIAVAQLFGGVGTMDVWGEDGILLLEKFAKRLGLKAPAVSWHTARDRIAEFIACLAINTATLARIADEIRTLARPELNELQLSFRHGQVGSSTMPHKRNPEKCQQVVVLAKLVKAQATLGFEAMLPEHERDSRALRLEWVAVTDACLYACGASGLMKQILPGVQVNAERMQKNLDEVAPFLGSEALMIILGRHIGKQTAHQKVYDICQSAIDQGQPLIDKVLADPVVTKYVSEQAIREGMNPLKHIGSSAVLIDRVLEPVKRMRNRADNTRPTGKE